jgi:hypothetical protein
MLHRYIAIHRYINIRAKSGYATNPLHSFKALHGHPSATFFWQVSPYTANRIFSQDELKSRPRLTT